MISKEELKQRGEHSLLNVAEITDEALDAVMSEMSDVSLASPAWAINDFAYLRLKIYLKIALDEQDVWTLEKAHKALIWRKDDEKVGGFASYKYACV